MSASGTREDQTASQTVREATPAELREALAGRMQIRFSPQVLQQLKEMGMTPDELIARMARDAGLLQ